ncbi:MAG TPA: DUF6412 domain-containing protein [Jiangellaceae bacterium]
MPAILSLLIELLGGSLDSAIALSGSPGAATMLAIIAAAGLFFVFAVASYSDMPVAAGSLQPAAVRRRAERTAFLPLCDPAAPGRPRPRAPSARHRAA